jgi:outer membrane protein assembly factor BamB
MLRSWKSAIAALAALAALPPLEGAFEADAGQQEGGAAAQLLAQWRMSAHDARHTGRSQFMAPATPMGRWAFPVGDAGNTGSPSIGGDGTAYFGAGDVYAVRSNGQLKWRTAADTYATPALGYGGAAYVSSRGFAGSYLAAVRTSDGSELWRYPVRGFADSPPTIGPDGTVFVGVTENGLHAVRPDGTRRWRLVADPAFQYSSPAVARDGTVYVATVFGGPFRSRAGLPAQTGACDVSIGCGLLSAVAPDGALRWQYAYENSVGFFVTVVPAPAIGPDGTIYVASTDGLHAVSADGTLKWQYAYVDGAPDTPSIDVDGVAYVAVGTNLHAVALDGTGRWQFAAGDFLTGSPAIGADGAVHAAARDGVLYAVEPDGTLRWSFSIGQPSFGPAIGLNRVFIGAWNGQDARLLAIGPAD